MLMPITITVTDTAWGVNHITGQITETTIDTKTFPLTLGEIGPIGPAYKKFTVTEMTSSTVTLVLNQTGRKATISVGETFLYRPRSFGGGHAYTITIE